MEKTLIFGHKNPDTDSICAAIAYADLKEKLGESVEPVRLGGVNGETQYALDTFGVEAPRFVENVGKETSKVILVDHNERQQSADGLDQVRITEVIDHHRIANFETADPLYYRAEPVGCTATILNKMYREHGVRIEKHMAGLLLSAIISDSLLFKSPTCTQEDIVAARELADIAGVDMDEYGLSMLKAGADLSSKTSEELIALDAKEFTMGAQKVEVAQVNAVDTEEVLARKEDLEKAMNATIEQKDLDLFLLVVTDILNSNSIAVASGGASHAVEKAFDVKLETNQALLEGVVSRKKQIVPQLTEALEK